MSDGSLRVDEPALEERAPGAARLRLTARGAARAQPRSGLPARGREGSLPRAAHGQDAEASGGVSTSSPPVLIAGGDSERRAELRRELAELMPAETRFEELETAWELLVRAPVSRAVILSGDLDEAPAESLLHTLTHRYPGLPVVSFGEPSPADR
jgi:hypothetical protein